MTYPVAMKVHIIRAIECSTPIPTQMPIPGGCIEQTIPLPASIRRGQSGLAEVVASATLLLLLAETYDDVIAAIDESSTFNRYFAAPKLGRTIEELDAMLKTEGEKIRQEAEAEAARRADAAAAELMAQIQGCPVAEITGIAEASQGT